MNKWVKIILGVLIVIIVGALLAFILYDNHNSHEMNDRLKKELYEAKNEIAELRKEKNNARAEADEWFSNYIELGIQCGANE